MIVPIEVSGIWLVREGEYIIVRAEVDGVWVEVIREHHDGPFSHIVEPEGIRAARAKLQGRLEAGDNRERTR